MKELRSQGNGERRARMFREVAAYRTLTESTRIPKFVESNAAEYRDPAFKLYLITELIPGQALDAASEARDAPWGYAAALRCIDALLDAVEYAHANDFVHRDIKPGNIVLRNCEIGNPVLVDFGLSFESLPEEGSQETLLGTELGNRFLRLPELGPDSPNKRDPRSDLTFVVGILYFLLTKRAPYLVGTGSDGRFAHQRCDPKQFMTDAPQHVVLAVKRILDKGFQTDLRSRFQDIGELRSQLAHVTEGPSRHASSKIDAARRVMSDRQEVTLQRNSKLVRGGVMAAFQACNRIANQVGLRPYGLGSQWGELEASTALALIRHGEERPDKKVAVRYTVQLVGDELVLLGADYSGVPEQIWRWPADSGPPSGDDFDKEVQSFALRHFQ